MFYVYADLKPEGWFKLTTLNSKMSARLYAWMYTFLAGIPAKVVEL